MDDVLLKAIFACRSDIIVIVEPGDPETVV